MERPEEVGAQWSSNLALSMLGFSGAGGGGWDGVGGHGWHGVGEGSHRGRADKSVPGRVTCSLPPCLSHPVAQSPNQGIILDSSLCHCLSGHQG